MNTKRQIIRKQGQEIDRLDYENNSLKLKLEQAELKIKHLRTKNDRLRDSLDGHKSVLAVVREELDRANKVNEHLKQQCKEMHRAKASAIGWKREAYRIGAKFDAVMATYAQSEEHNMALSRSLERACGKLDVFERVLGELPEAAQPEPKTQGE